jgi:PhzF family phenazine biosynthesis protein
MKLPLWQVDAFASRPFEGNPAAIVPLEAWIPDATMQAIAGENNLSETAFFVKEREGHYALRWFTPAVEVELCGHATLASAYVVFTTLAPHLNEVSFSTRSGILTVSRRQDGLSMSLPADTPRVFTGSPDTAERLGQALGVAAPAELVVSRNLMAVWNDAAFVRAIRPSESLAPLLAELGIWGLIATAPGDAPHDFISRFFAPAKGVPEDPVTGSAHCLQTPFWAARLGKQNLRAFQASKRGGDLLCTDDNDRIVLAGTCALYLKGEIEI